MRIANRTAMRAAVATAAAGALAAGVFALVSSASASTHALASMHQMTAAGQPGYSFRTVDDAADPTFNQLLGVNSAGVIAGYFGSGVQGHPNQGYQLTPAGYRAENFPGSVQTQVTGLNDQGVTVGFYSTMNTANQANDNFGFYADATGFHAVNYPTADNASPPVNQLLGVNDHGVAVGFWTDGQGSSHGYEYSIGSGTFSQVTDPGNPGASLTAAAINNAGDVAGFYARGKATDGFLLSHGHFTDLAVPGSSATMALGVNDSGEVAGAYTTGSGNSAKTHGFTWTPQGGFRTVDDPHGIGATTVNGINDHGELVGFYTDAKGNTDGFTAVRSLPSVTRVQLQAMPHASVTFAWAPNGQLTAQLNGYGFTPGSSHLAELASPQGGIIAQFGTLTADGTGQVHQTLYSSDTASVPVGSRLVILLDGPSGAIASQPIAQTRAIAAGQMSYQLQAVEDGPTGASYGTPQGWATVAYDAAARTLTVTVTASGLTPGAHAAHIHLGSCASQGPVQYMLMDFTADSQGRISHESRTVTGVTGPAPASGWYLNLHQGNSGNISANGQPTANFRPLLCGNL